jgi:phosphoglycolate phosphatase-like HAD superfamily hydrolase
VSSPIRLLALDGDHTLWQPLDGACASERYVDDPEGWADFRFAADPADPDLIAREDGPRFRLMPGARAALQATHAAGIRLAMVSFNHVAPIRAMLAAFALAPLFAQVEATWSSDKATMLRAVLAAEAAAGRPIAPEQTLFVDDDPWGIYRPMAAAVGVRFAQMGGEVRGFADVAALLGIAAPDRPDA